MNSSAALSIVADNDPGIVTLDDGSLSLTIPAETSFEDWQAIGRRLFARERVINWWIGDWWAFGEHRYGERAKMAAEGIWGLSFSTLVTYGSVSRSFETARRLAHVPFSAHQEVAVLPPAEADALLTKAGEESLSVRDVRKAAMLRKVALGIIRPRDDVQDDPDYAALKAIAAYWNRANRDVREQFLDMANEADLGVIEV